MAAATTHHRVLVAILVSVPCGAARLVREADPTGASGTLVPLDGASVTTTAAAGKTSQAAPAVIGLEGKIIPPSGPSLIHN